MNGPVRPGYHQIIWDGKTSDGLEVPTGIYIARLTVRPAGQARLVTPEYSKSIKMLLPLLHNISRQSCYLVKNIRRDQQD